MTMQEQLRREIAKEAELKFLADKTIAEITKRLEALEAALLDDRLKVLEHAWFAGGKAEPKPTAVPDPVAGEVWAGKDGACIVCYLEGGNVWFLSVASSCIIGNMRPSAITLMSWHAWVRETQAKRIWPEVKEV